MLTAVGADHVAYMDESPAALHVVRHHDIFPFRAFAARLALRFEARTFFADRLAPPRAPRQQRKITAPGLPWMGQRATDSGMDQRSIFIDFGKLASGQLDARAAADRATVHDGSRDASTVAALVVEDRPFFLTLELVEHLSLLSVSSARALRVDGAEGAPFRPDLERDLHDLAGRAVEGDSFVGVGQVAGQLGDAAGQAPRGAGRAVPGLVLLSQGVRLADSLAAELGARSKVVMDRSPVDMG